MNKSRKLLASPGILMLFIFAVAPLFIMLYYSFVSDGAAGGFTLSNYTHFFSKDFYLKLTWRTISNSLIVTGICLIIAYPLAYLIGKKFKRGGGALIMLLLIPFFTNQLVRVYSWLIFLQDGGIFESFLKTVHILKEDAVLGILYTRVAVIIGLVHVFFPYMVITIYMALEKLDDALLEASRSLGASPVITFFKITLPLSWPGILSGIMLVFVPCLGTFVEPRILGGVNGSVIGTVIEDQFFEIYGWNFGAAIAFILFAMVLVTIGALNRLGKEKNI